MIHDLELPYFLDSEPLIFTLFCEYLQPQRVAKRAHIRHPGTWMQRRRQDTSSLCWKWSISFSLIGTISEFELKLKADLSAYGSAPKSSLYIYSSALKKRRCPAIHRPATRGLWLCFCLGGFVSLFSVCLCLCISANHWVVSRCFYKKGAHWC